MRRRAGAQRQLRLFDEEPVAAARAPARVVRRKVQEPLRLPRSPFTWDALAKASGAWITDDYLHRLVLWRSWSMAGRALFVMLNPSKADEYANDPTVRRCIGFAKLWDCGGVNIANLYSLIATDPRDLWSTEPEDRVIAEDACVLDELIARSSGPIVAAWGVVPAAAQARINAFSAALARHGRRADCLGMTRTGHPHHPVRLPYAQQLVPYACRPGATRAAGLTT